MCDCPDTICAFCNQRLYILNTGGSRSGVSHMSDADVSGKLIYGVFSKNLTDKSDAFYGTDLFTITDNNSRAFLAPVLLSVKALVN